VKVNDMNGKLWLKYNIEGIRLCQTIERKQDVKSFLNTFLSLKQICDNCSQCVCD